MSRYNKAIVAVLGAGLTVLAAGLTDDVPGISWQPVIAAMITAIGVWAFPNKPPPQ